MEVFDTLYLDWHAMCCPSCFRADALDVEATVYVRLVPTGADADLSEDGSQTWDHDSPCQCKACGFTAPVRCFKQWGEAGDPLNMTEEESDGEAPCTFEIVVSGMVTGTPGDGVVSPAETGPTYTLADSYTPARTPEFFDIELRRLRVSTGEIWVIHELGNLTEEEANGYADDFENDYPFAGMERV